MSRRRHQRERVRRARWRALHLWLGLSLGLPLALIGLTGSVLVFWQELDAALNPALYRVVGGENSRAPLEATLAAAIGAAPPGWQSLWLPVPNSPQASFPFHFYYPPDTAPLVGAESLNVFVDPSTARVIGTRVFYHAWNPLRHCLMGFVFKLHYALLLKSPGTIAVGLMACALLGTTMAGLMLWWPGRGGWRRALSIKRAAAPARLNHDVHQVTGVYGLPVMLALLVSGIYFNLPDQFEWLVTRFSPVTAPVTAPSPAGPGSVALDTLLASSRAWQGGRLEQLTLTAAENPIVEACFAEVPDLASTVLARRCLSFSRHTGELLRISDPRHGTSGDVVMQWQWPLHSGQAFGAVGRGLVLMLGLCCPVLAATGVIRYCQKRRAARVHATRAGAASAPPSGLA